MVSFCLLAAHARRKPLALLAALAALITARLSLRRMANQLVMLSGCRTVGLMPSAVQVSAAPVSATRSSRA